MPSRLDFHDYQVAWIAPLEIEVKAALYMLDNLHEGNFESDAGDNYQYIGGDINGHNILIATFPEGTQYGGNSAAALAAQVRKCMGNSLWFGLLVGIAAGLPNLSANPPNDIRLGDVLISLSSSGVIQHDMGKQTTGGFENTSQQTNTLEYLRSAFTKIKSLTPIKGHTFLQHLQKVQELADDQGRLLFQDPGEANDLLYKTVGSEEVLEQRQPRNEPRIRTWYGTIGSGNTLMKSSQERDELRDRYKLIGLEMEAHGTMNTIPVGHIRGVCDYADKHKNKEWQGFAAAVAAAYAREVLCSINPRKDGKVFSVIPLPRNKNFVGREIKLLEIEKRLASNDSCERLALYGLGGCGKTAIALEFAYRTKDKNPKCSIFWVPAINKESFEKSYLEIGKLLQIPGISDPKADVKQLVQERLSDAKSGEWLLVIDNADDVEVLFKKFGEDAETKCLIDFVPSSPLGSILFTTRTRKAAINESPTSVLDLHEMDPKEAKKMLVSTLLNSAAKKGDENLTQLLELLTFLPLAIVQAVSYINKNDVSILEYIKLYQGSEIEIIKHLERDFEDPGRYQGVKNPIATTWFISFEQIRKFDKLAEEYLSFMACLLRENVPKSLLPPSSCPDEFMEALGTLKAYSFITKRRDGDSFDMHRLVHLATRNWLKHEKDNQLRPWTKVALGRLKNMLFPKDDYKDIEVWRNYLPHAIHVANSPEIPREDGLRLKLLFDIGKCQLRLGHYKSAGTTYDHLVGIRTETNGKENPETLTCMANLAHSFFMDEKQVKAELLNREVLNLRKKVLGESDRQTLSSMNNLAACLGNQGKYADAEIIYREALESDTKFLGKEHPLTLLITNNLSTNLQEQGKYAEAEKSFRELLSSRKKILGEDHPHTIGTLEKLAHCLRKQGNVSESERLFQMVVEISKKILGTEHPETLSAINGLIDVQIRKGERGIHLEPICKKQLALSKKVSGEEHQNTLYAMKNLAWVLQNQKQYSEAEMMNQKFLTLQEKSLGQEHPATLVAMYNLALVLTLMGKPEGDALHMETLTLREKVLGPFHSQTLEDVSAVAQIREREGRYEEAYALYQRAFESYRKTFGEQHAFTQKALRNFEGFLERRRLAKLEGGNQIDGVSTINQVDRLFDADRFIGGKRKTQNEGTLRRSKRIRNTS